MESMLDRGLRASFSQDFGRPEAIHPPVPWPNKREMPSLWVHSLVDWLSELGQNLWRHGVGGGPETIRSFTQRANIVLPEDSLLKLAEAGLHTVLDLLCQDASGVFRWDSNVFDDCPFLRQLGRLPIPGNVTSFLLPGQCWATENDLFPRSAGYVLEYLGQAGPDACVRVWARNMWSSYRCCVQ